MTFKPHTMKRVFNFAVIAALVAACTPMDQKTDYDLQWDKYTVKLVIADETGKHIPAFEGKYLALPGFVFSRGQIRMHPGKQYIGYICRRNQSDIEVLDVAPAVEYDFKAGKRYELTCVGGQPKIRELNSEEF